MTTFARISIKQRGSAGYFLTSEDEPISGWSAVEEDPDTDFSLARRLLIQHLDVNYPENAPHRVTFETDPDWMALFGEARARIERTPTRH